MTERGYGSAEEGGHNAATQAYKGDPTIENYVRLRRGDPAAEIEVRAIGSFDSMFYMRDEFERYGLDPELLGGLLDANQAAISEASLRIMEEMISARRLHETGETQLISRGKAIPDKLVDWIICCALDALSWNDDLDIPRDLIVLIRERLAGSDPYYEQLGRVREQRQQAAVIAGQLKAQGVTPTFKMLGKILGVSASTVVRWFEPGEFEQESETWRRLFNETGRLRPF